MKTTLILPPADTRNCECFQLPNVSIPVLTDCLRTAGVTVLQEDLDVAYHSVRLSWRGRHEVAVLNDRTHVIKYLEGRLPPREAAKLEALEDALFGLRRFETSDLFGISLMDFKTDFLLNAAALIANRLRKTFSVPIVIGNKGLSRSLYQEILEQYPVFDFAIYTNNAGEALLNLMRHLRGRKAQPLAGTLERKPDGAVVSHDALDDPLETIYAADYRGYPLQDYEKTGSQILSHYNCETPFFKKLERTHGSMRQQIVLTQFETTCRGRCIFCAAASASKNFQSNCRSIPSLIKEFRVLKELGVTGIYFINSQFNNHYEFAENLCDEMLRQRLTFQWSDCVNFRELDESLLDKMRASGAVKLTFGLETGSARMLRYIRKGSTPERVSRFLKHSHSLGIWNHVELIGGLPTETEQDVAATADFLRAHADVIDVHSLNPFYLYSGSPLRNEPHSHGIALRPKTPNPDYFDYDENIGIYSEKFDELGGLSWEQKDRQISAATETLLKTIAEINPPVGIDYIHINLLMYLYAVYGHERKDLIRKLMRICTAKFKPYNVDFFLRPPFYEKHKFRRVLKETPDGAQG